MPVKSLNTFVISTGVPQRSGHDLRFLLRILTQTPKLVHFNQEIDKNGSCFSGPYVAQNDPGVECLLTLLTVLFVCRAYECRAKLSRWKWSGMIQPGPR